jgi:hypothetical protein
MIFTFFPDIGLVCRCVSSTDVFLSFLVEGGGLPGLLLK